MRFFGSCAFIVAAVTGVFDFSATVQPQGASGTIAENDAILGVAAFCLSFRANGLAWGAARPTSTLRERRVTGGHSGCEARLRGYRNWRLIALGNLFLAGGLAADLIWQAARGTGCCRRGPCSSQSPAASAS